MDFPRFLFNSKENDYYDEDNGNYENYDNDDEEDEEDDEDYVHDDLQFLSLITHHHLSNLIKI